jgi:hypothetical protein
LSVIGSAAHASASASDSAGAASAASGRAFGSISVTWWPPTT